MTSRDFAYWLQGLFELAEVRTLDARQTELIKRHLHMVFIHEIDPSFPDEEQGPLTAAHNGVRPGGLIAKCLYDL
jgi:hypothetical protein